MAKLRRITRYRKLRDEGFFPHEANVLSTIHFSVPWVKQLRAERKAKQKKAIRQGLSENQFNRQIKKEYERNGWMIDKVWVKTRKEWRKAGAEMKFDTWAMIHAIEDRYKDSHPEYESSGWRNRQKKFKADRRKYENSVRNREGKPYG